jgi:hypothetical protein
MSKPVTPQEMFDLWQKMVNPGAYPLQSLMFPVLDPKELQKKIGELEIVEHWLKANVNMVRLTIQSLQFQLAMVKGGAAAADALKNPGAGAASGAAPAGAGEGAEDVPDRAAWPWSFMSVPGSEPKPAPQAPRGSPRKKKKAE